MFDLTERKIWPSVYSFGRQQNAMHFAFILFFYVVFSSVDSAVIHVDQVEIPGHEGKCYDKSERIFYSKGEVIQNEGAECAERKCLGFVEETKKIRIEILTCPAVEAGPGCTVVQDLSKTYPGCCPQLVSMPSVQPTFCKSEQKQEK